MNDRAAQFRTLYIHLRIADQQEFYESRSKEYADAHRQALVLRNILLLLSAAAGIGGQLVAGTGRAGLSVIAAVLAALAGAVTAFEAVMGFPKLKKLFEDAALNLSAAKIDWDTIEPDRDVSTGVEQVEKIFRTENGQWGQLVAEGAAKGTPTAREDKR